MEKWHMAGRESGIFIYLFNYFYVWLVKAKGEAGR